MARQTKSDIIYQNLRRQIEDGSLQPGQTLPPEIAFAKQYGVAVLTLRRALARLREDGWIMSRPYHGTKICLPSKGHAHSAGKKPATVLGLILKAGANTLTHPSTSRLVNGFEGTLSEAGYSLDIAYSKPDDPKVEEALLQRLGASPACGWLAPVPLAPKVRELLKTRHIPVVLVHFSDESLTGHVFEVDYRSLADDVLSHLGETGRRNICLVSPERTHWSWAFEAAARTSCSERNASRSGENPWPWGFETAAGETFNGCSLSRLLVEDFSAGAGERAIRMRPGANRDFDAFVCMDDDIAAGVVRGLEAIGKSIPEDVSVIGGGDFPIGSLFKPKLTTVSYPYFAIGREAGRLLIDLLRGTPLDPVHRKFLPRLIVRESSVPSTPASKKAVVAPKS